MILNRPNHAGRNNGDQTMTALLWIARNTCPFYLCGSYFFGDAKQGSDFDFFTETSTKIRYQLLLQGFKRVDLDYPDGNSLELYILGRVHVILVEKVAARLNLQDYLLENDRWKTRPKKDSDFYREIYKKLGYNFD